MSASLKAKVERTVFLPLDLAEKLAERAAREGKSNAAVIVEAVRSYLEDEEGRGDPGREPEEAACG